MVLEVSCGLAERAKKRKSEVLMRSLSAGPLSQGLTEAMYVEMLRKYSTLDQVTCTYMSETNEHILYIH